MKMWLRKIYEIVLNYKIVQSICVIVVIVIMLILIYHFKPWKGTIPVKLHNRTYSEMLLDEEFEKLESIYSDQSDELWYTFASGIKSVLRENPHQPSVFLLVFDNEDAGKTAECLAKQVSNLATRYLMSSTKAPIIFNDYDVNSIKDPGEVIDKLKGPVRSRGAMIVTNLQDIKPPIAEMLHFFCDRYSPAVEKAVYFITLKVDKFRNKNVQTDAVEKLEQLWGEHMKKHVFQPLVTRLTPTTLKVLNGQSHC